MRVLAHLFLIIADCKYWPIRDKSTNLSLDILVQFESFQASHRLNHQWRRSDAEFITNTSLYPLKSGSIYMLYPTNEFEILPTLLVKNEYNKAHAHEKKASGTVIMSTRTPVLSISSAKIIIRKRRKSEWRWTIISFYSNRLITWRRHKNRSFRF